MLQHVIFFAKGCLPDRVFLIPTWYKYLDSEKVGGKCSPVFDLTNNPQGSILAILLAVFDILIFFAGIIAVAYIIVGSVQFMLSQGEPDRVKKARGTLLNAIIGLVIVLVSSAAVNLIGNILT